MGNPFRFVSVALLLSLMFSGLDSLLQLVDPPLSRHYFIFIIFCTFSPHFLVYLFFNIYSHPPAFCLQHFSPSHLSCELLLCCGFPILFLFSYLFSPVFLFSSFILLTYHFSLNPHAQITVIMTAPFQPPLPLSHIRCPFISVSRMFRL